jgi:hypothetical protein
MKIAHWTMVNTSGMFNVAESLVKAEKTIGLDSLLMDFAEPDLFAPAMDADVHVVHTHMPDEVTMQATKPIKTVWVAHGTPEHVFTGSVIRGLHDGYGASDSWQLCQYWMQNADALVTFWPRHQKIWKSLCDKNTIVDCFPMGLDKEFWKPVPSAGKYMGTPSLFTAENCDYSKWPLDLLLMWPWVWKDIPKAHLHANYIPTDQHRWFNTLLNRNGSGFKTISSGMLFNPTNLRNAFCSTDYYIGLVRYGDANRMSLESNASGAKTISYAGNEYSDFWLHEGDQREMAKELLAILKGDVSPRTKLVVDDVLHTAASMKAIYERIA